MGRQETNQLKDKHYIYPYTKEDWDYCTQNTKAKHLD